MDGLLWMITRQPMGPRGVASKFKEPLEASQVERKEAMVDWRRRLRESLVYGRSLSHK